MIVMQDSVDLADNDYLAMELKALGEIMKEHEDDYFIKPKQ